MLGFTDTASAVRPITAAPIPVVEPSSGMRKIPVAVERRSGKDRRAGRAQGRYQIDLAASGPDQNHDEMAFMQAMDQYKRSKGRPFPTWIEVLDVLRGLGYEKNAERTLTIAQLES